MLRYRCFTCTLDTSVGYEPRDSVTEFSQTAAEWLTELDLWSSQPDHTLYQIIGLTNEEMKRWFETECQNNSSLSNRFLGSLHESPERPFINMVIFDDREVFLAFRELKQHISQANLYHIQSKEMTNLMKKYFLALFDKSDKCPRPSSLIQPEDGQ